jgi:hypothetical protein
LPELGSGSACGEAAWRARAAQAMRAAAPAYPGLDEFLAENVLTVPSDAEALAVFSGSG